MKDLPRVFVDFMNTDGKKHPDGKRRVLLTTTGTREDLASGRIELHEGLRLMLYSDDADEHGRPDPLIVEGTVRFDSVGQRWVAEVDWDAVRHESDDVSRKDEDQP